MAPGAQWQEWFAHLVERGRAMRVHAGDEVLWCAVESRVALTSLLTTARFSPDLHLPAGSEGDPEADATAAAAVRGHLELMGPVTAADLAAATTLSATNVAVALA